VPELIDTTSRVGILVVAMNELIATEGIPGLTLRKIAEVSRVSTGSMIHHLGGKSRRWASCPAETTTC
jgi:AcrR family transcriptional regulator